MSKRPVVDVVDVHKTFQTPGPWPWSSATEVPAVRGVSLRVMPGEVVALVGQSGSGKTTLARIILGLEQPSSGRVEINGLDWSALTESERRPLRKNYQYVPQDALSALDPQQTAYEAVVESLRVLAGLSKEQAHLRAKTLLSQLGLGARMHALPREMSGGEQRRVTLARVFALEPTLVVADEPTSGLDADRQEAVLKVLVENLPEGSGCILVTHDIAAAKRWCNRAIVMLDGEIVEEVKTPDGIPSHPYAKLLFDPWSDHDLTLSTAN
jgi:peptide/nickel transport system ATP-binding protein